MSSNINEEVAREKVQKFESELQALQDKHGIAIVPIVNYSQHGMFPGITFMDKKQLEQQLQGVQAQVQNG